MTDLYQHIAATIRRLRTTYAGGKLSQEALAEAIGEPANTVSRWETATYKPTAEQLEKLARFFNVSITIFFPGMAAPKDEQLSALMSATGGLTDEDLDEVVRYAEFRRVRRTLKEGASRKSRKAEPK